MVVGLQNNAYRDVLLAPLLLVALALVPATPADLFRAAKLPAPAWRKRVVAEPMPTR